MPDVIKEPQCLICKWFLFWEDYNPPKCLAFVGRIPDAIWNCEFDHANPYEGDKGYEFILASKYGGENANTK